MDGTQLWAPCMPNRGYNYSIAKPGICSLYICIFQQQLLLWMQKLLVAMSGRAVSMQRLAAAHQAEV